MLYQVMLPRKNACRVLQIHINGTHINDNMKTCGPRRKPQKHRSWNLSWTRFSILEKCSGVRLSVISTFFSWNLPRFMVPVMVRYPLDEQLLFDLEEASVASCTLVLNDFTLLGSKMLLDELDFVWDVFETTAGLSSQ